MTKPALDNIIFLILGLFAFSVTFSVTVVETALLATLALILAKKYCEQSLSSLKPSLTKSPFFVSWMAYLGACLLTTITAYYPLKGLNHLNSDFLKYICLSTLLLAVKKEQLPKLSAIYICSALIFALIGIGEVTGFFPADNPDTTRADAFMNAVRYGEVMGIAVLLALSQAILPAKASSRRTQVLYLISAAIIFTALLASKTRGAWLGTFVGTISMFFAARASWKRSTMVFATLLLMTAVSAQIVPHILVRLVRMQETTKEILSAAPSRNVRPMMWRVGAKMVAAHPLLGVGPGNIRPTFAKYCPELILDKSWGALHNLYIQQAAERGLLGLGALLLLFGTMFRFAFKNFKANKNPYTLWALCVLPAFYVMNITEISFQHVHTSFAIFLALAFSAADRAEV